MIRSFIPTLLTALLALVLVDAAHGELVATQKGSKLKIKGAPDSDSIQLDGTGAIGRVLVSQAGVNPQSFLGVTDIEISTGTGNDQVFVNGIEIGGSLVVNAGDGVDQVDIDNTRLDGFAFPLMIGRNVTLRLGGESGEQVDVDTEDEAGFLIGGRTTIEGATDIDLNGDGAGLNHEVGDVLICGDLRISVGEALDQNGDSFSIDMDNVVVGGATRLNLSNRSEATGNDFVRITRSSFVRAFEANLRAGDDELHFDDLPSSFGADFVVRGGAGENVVFGAQLITVIGATKFTDIEE
jgi:hypothetical protein